MFCFVLFWKERGWKVHRTKGKVLGKAQFLWWVFLKYLVMKEKKEVSRKIEGPKKNFKIKQNTHPSLFLSKVTVQKNCSSLYQQKRTLLS